MHIDTRPRKRRYSEIDCQTTVSNASVSASRQPAIPRDFQCAALTQVHNRHHSLLLKLPREVLLRTFAYAELTPPEMFEIGGVCRDVYSVMHDNVLWRSFTPSQEWHALKASGACREAFEKRGAMDATLNKIWRGFPCMFGSDSELEAEELFRGDLTRIYKFSWYGDADQFEAYGRKSYDHTLALAAKSRGVLMDIATPWADDENLLGHASVDLTFVFPKDASGADSDS